MKEMKDIKIELLGIGVMLLVLTASTHNFFGYVGGIIGFGLIAAGCFSKDK